jgi:hypothetical protein
MIWILVIFAWIFAYFIPPPRKRCVHTSTPVLQIFVTYCHANGNTAFLASACRVVAIGRIKRIQVTSIAKSFALSAEGKTGKGSNIYICRNAGGHKHIATKNKS